MLGKSKENRMSPISFKFPYGMSQGAIYYKARGVMLAALKYGLTPCDTNVRLGGTVSQPLKPRLPLRAASITA